MSEQVDMDALELRAMRFQKLNPLHECFNSVTTLALIARVREAEAALERVRELHRDGDWECGNPSHTNPEVGCPDCWVACASCQESYPCPTIRALEGASS